METYDDCWEIVNRRGITDGVHKWYEVQLLVKDKQADRKIERLEKEISRLKSMSLFQRIFRWGK